MSRAHLDVLVVEDEAPARDELVFLLRQNPQVGQVAEAADATQCLASLESSRFDAVFLDVRMPGLDGIQLARVIGRSLPVPAIVFVTGFEQHAVEAFGLAAVDYLLKPVRPERLQVTIRRLSQVAMASEGPPPTGRVALEDRLPVTDRGEIRLVALEDIRLATTGGERAVVVTASGRFRTQITLQEFERRMSGRTFLRVHRGYIVNLSHVASIEPFFNGTYLLKLTGIGETVPVSRRHAADLRAAIGL